MKNPKPNISLKNISDLHDSGIILSLKKGFNEVLNRRVYKSHHKKLVPVSEYKDMLSVILCTSNLPEQSVATIKSLLNQSLSSDKYEIILVNNSGTDFILRDFGGNLKIKVVTEATPGLSKARNTGAAAAMGEYLLYTDDDAVADENLLLCIYNAFKEHKKFSIIGGQIFLKLPTPKPSVFLDGREALWSGYTVPYKIFKEVREQYEFPYGACFGVRHSVLDTLGAFPCDYGRCGNNYAGGEETALCFKARKLGFKIGVEPKAYVHHCVSEKRFSKEHIQKTIRAGIITTYRLCRDGYAPYKWTENYINERIKILNCEIERLKKQYKALHVFYKECELNAFTEIKEAL